MASRHLLGTSSSGLDLSGRVLDPARSVSVRFAYLGVMDTRNPADGTFEVLTLAELADRLHVTVQTLYDLRSKGRGPRGFRVGRRLMFRVSEIEAWLGRMEREDGSRRSAGAR